MNHETNNHEMNGEVVIANVLRWGVAISLVLLALGTLFAFLQPGEYGTHGGTVADFQRLLAHPDLALLTWPGFLHMLKSGRGEALIAPGLLLLISTPLLRVAVSIVMFALEKDGKYVVITSTVLVLVLLSFLL
jgi:uncharacterized membrane protein